MTVFSFLSFIAGTVFGIAVVVRSVGDENERPPEAGRRPGRKSVPPKLEQRRADIWFGVASQLVWGSIVACFSLVGALVTLHAVPL